MFFINKFSTLLTALFLAKNSLAFPFHNENENEEKGLSGFTATHLRRSALTVPVVKKEKSLKRNTIKRVLERRATNIFSRVHEDDDCCCSSDNDVPTASPMSSTTESITASPIVSPTSSPTSSPTANPTYSIKKLVASDGGPYNGFGSSVSCSMMDDLVAIGATEIDQYTGAAYLFRLDGTEVSKLEPGDNGAPHQFFGRYISIDEKVVVSGEGDYIKIFSHEGVHERTLTCDECSGYNEGYIFVNGLGGPVATHGDKIVTRSTQGQNAGEKLRIYSTNNGELLKEFEQENVITELAMSEQYIVVTTVESPTFLTGVKNFVYSNVSPDFTKIAEIDQGGYSVAVSSDKLVIGNWINNAAYLYSTDGEFIKELEHDSGSGSQFGFSVTITDENILIGAPLDGESNTGSVFIYSADGEPIKRVVPPDDEDGENFGSGVCVSGSAYFVGFAGNNQNTGAVYRFNIPS